MSQTLAFDLGGSSLRLAVVAPDGSFVGMVRKPLNVQRAGEQCGDGICTHWEFGACEADCPATDF